MACQTCHFGPADRTFANAEEAHVDIVRDPSAFNEAGEIPACVGCHASDVAATANSLHTNLWGEIAAIELRGGAGCTVLGTDLEPFFDAKCASCHTTCGQCHVSRPNSVAGGFPLIAGQYSSHRFRSPNMGEQCTACHGSRVGTDYRGELEGNTPDVHYQSPLNMDCNDCHSKEEIHGDGQHAGDHYEHRYEVATMPRCETCHPDVGDDTPAENNFHSMHVDGAGSNLQCQVCHSQPYKNCTNCHNLVADGKNAPEKYDINPSRVQMKFARNYTVEGEFRNLTPYRTDYDIVVVRHTPVDPGTYADWGLELPDYLVEPTWKYASPHNVMELTPQCTPPEGGTCYDACHSTPDSPEGWFLRESDLYDEGGAALPDYEANIRFVIPETFPSDK